LMNGQDPLLPREI